VNVILQPGDTLFVELAGIVGTVVVDYDSDGARARVAVRDFEVPGAMDMEEREYSNPTDAKQSRSRPYTVVAT